MQNGKPIEDYQDLKEKPIKHVCADEQAMVGSERLGGFIWIHVSDGKTRQLRFENASSVRLHLSRGHNHRRNNTEFFVCGLVFSTQSNKKRSGSNRSTQCAFGGILHTESGTSKIEYPRQTVDLNLGMFDADA